MYKPSPKSVFWEHWPKLGFDEVIVLIGGFALGPWAAVCIEALKIALNLLIGGTITMGVGELTNFLIGLSFVLPATIIYQRDKTRKHALFGLIAGTICMTILGGLLNYFVMLPAYSYFMNLNGLLALVLMATTPFNVLKGVLCSIVVFLSYKKVSPVIKKQ